MRSKDPILGDSECIDMVAIHLTSQHTQVKFPCINVQNRAYCQKKLQQAKVDVKKSNYEVWWVDGYGTFRYFQAIWRGSSEK